MTEDATKKEESGKPSEKKEEKVGKTSDFGAIGREIKKFEEEAKEEPSEETEIKPGEKPEEKPAEESETEDKDLESKEKPEEEEKPEPTMWLIDKDGNKTPFIVKARGKFYTPETAEKALAYGSIAIDANERNKTVKEKEEELVNREKELNKYETFLQALDKADKEGKLYVEDAEGNKIRISDLKKEVGKEEEEEEDDELVDPEVKELRKRVKSLEAISAEDKKEKVKSLVDKAKGKIDKEIDGHREAYPGVFDIDGEESPKDVWSILEENPKMTVEEASKLSHESEVSFIKKRIEKNPDLYIDKDAIYADKVEEKTKKEEAPVEAPSEIPAGTPGQGETKDKFKGMTYDQIIKEGFKDVKASHKTAEKS